MEFPVMKKGIWVIVLVLQFLFQPESFAAVDSLDKALYKLEVETIVSEGEFEKLAQQYDSLAHTYTEPGELGRIYASRLRRYCQGRPQVPRVIVEYAVKALEFPLAPQFEMDVQLKLGDATWRNGIGEPDASLVSVRREAAVVYLKGIRVAVDHGVPYSALPTLPPGITVRGSGTEYERLRKEGEERYAAHLERKELEKLIAQRGELERSLLYLYALKPRDSSELRSMCEQYLVDETAVAKTMERLQTAVDEMEGRPIEGESVLHPNMPKDMREGMKYKDEDQYLEHASL